MARDILDSGRCSALDINVDFINLPGYLTLNLTPLSISWWKDSEVTRLIYIWPSEKENRFSDENCPPLFKDQPLHI